MMTTRSRATWDEVKTNPFLQQVRPARIARSLLVSRLIWGARLRYNGGSGRRREWPRALSPSRGDVRARPSRRRDLAIRSQGADRLIGAGARRPDRDFGRRYGQSRGFAATPEPLGQDPDADPGGWRDDLRQRRHRRISRLAGREREGDPIRTAGALPNIDPAGDGGWNRGGGRADPLRAPVA